MESVGKPNFEIQSTMLGSHTVIRARRNWFIIIFMGAWLGGWAMGEASAIGALFGLGPLAGDKIPGFGQAFLAFWLVGWTVGGAWAAYTLAQSLAGREELQIENNVLRTFRGIGRLGFRKEYDLNQARRFRVVDLGPLGGFAGKFSAMPLDSLKFDYGTKTIGLARTLNEAEAADLLAQLQKRHSQLRTQ